MTRGRLRLRDQSVTNKNNGYREVCSDKRFGVVRFNVLRTAMGGMKAAATTVALLVLLTLVAVLSADVTAVMAFFAPNITYPDAVLQHNDSPAAWDVFGKSVAVSGDTIVVGAPGDDNGATDSGSAYVFEYNGGAWTQTKLVPPGNQAFDQVGTSVAIDGDIILVSEFADGAGDVNTGAAHVYERVSGIWTHVRKLTVAGTNRFGWKVALSGNRAAVVSIGTATVYIYERNAGAGGWTAPPASISGVLGSAFGEDISLSGDLLLVGARVNGAGYVYDGKFSWLLVKTLTGPITEAFGFSVSISGNTAVIGAPGASTGSVGVHGAVYVFDRNPSTGTWGSAAKLVAGEVPGAGTAEDQVGTDVDIAGDTIVAGAWGDDVYADLSGSAYAFRRSGGVWTETNKFIQPPSGFGTGVQAHIFGRAVGTTGSRVVVGAPMFVGGANPPLPGHAYVFELAEPPRNLRFFVGDAGQSPPPRLGNPFPCGLQLTDSGPRRDQGTDTMPPKPRDGFPLFFLQPRATSLRLSVASGTCVASLGHPDETLFPQTRAST
jgi:hypothetical protein